MVKNMLVVEPRLLYEIHVRVLLQVMMVQNLSQILEKSCKKMFI